MYIDSYGLLTEKREFFFENFVEATFVVAGFDCSDADILILAETWLYPEVTNKGPFPDKDNYKIYQCDRVDKREGGMLIVVKNTVSSFHLDTNPFIKITYAVCISTYA